MIENVENIYNALCNFVDGTCSLILVFMNKQKKTVNFIDIYNNFGNDLEYDLFFVMFLQPMLKNKKIKIINSSDSITELEFAII